MTAAAPEPAAPPSPEREASPALPLPEDEQKMVADFAESEVEEENESDGSTQVTRVRAGAHKQKGFSSELFLPVCPGKEDKHQDLFRFKVTGGFYSRGPIN